MPPQERPEQISPDVELESLRRELLRYTQNDTPVPTMLIQAIDIAERNVLRAKKSMATKSKGNPMTPELENKLFEAKAKLEDEREGRILSSLAPNQGRREQQYLEHARKHKRETMTPLELVYSEVPTCIASINHRRLIEIVHTVRVPQITGDGETKGMQYFCANCNLDTPREFAYLCNGYVWCALHVPDLTTCNACNKLREGCKKITTYDGRQIMACTSCLDRRTECVNCEKKIGPEFVESCMCEKCLDSGNDTGPIRSFSKGVKWIGKSHGDIIKSPRVFSCEIEAFTKDDNWPTVLYKALPKEVGITEDGSLRNEEGLRGFELQTPKLAGSKGEELVRHMITSTKAVDAFVSPLCGMHVHIDGAGILGPSRREYPTALLQLWRTYIVFEDVIMSFLPFSRRRNDYCRPMSEAFKVNDLDIIESLAEAERFWYKERTYSDIVNAKGHQYHASRYFGANFHSLLAHGHFEVRFHSGTLNANKVLQWANLHALILDACAAGKMNVDFFREAQATYNLPDKTNLLFSQIGLAESSKQFYRARQKTFLAKRNEDDETKGSGRPHNQQAPQITGRNRNVVMLQQMVRRNGFDQQLSSEQFTYRANIPAEGAVGMIRPRAVEVTNEITDRMVEAIENNLNSSDDGDDDELANLI